MTETVTDRKRIGVLVSGAGSNLAALLERAAEPNFPGEVVLVISNRRDAGALGVAGNWKVASVAMPAEDFGDRSARDLAMLGKMREANVDLVVCAGYDRVLSDEFLAGYPDAILNVHPSLLPAFAGGLRAVEDALEHGVRVTGCTVHFVAPGGTDGGPIVLQGAVLVDPGDDAESLALRIHEQEWRLLPDAVSLWCQGRLVREGRRVRVRNGHARPVPV